MACRSVLAFCRVFAARNPISALKFLYQDDPQRSSSSRKTNLQNRIVGAQLLGSCNQTPERPRGSFGGTLWDAGTFSPGNTCEPAPDGEMRGNPRENKWIKIVPNGWDLKVPMVAI